MDSAFSEIKSEPQKKYLFSKAQITVLVLVLIFVGAFVLNRQFGWFNRFFYERVEIPSGAPYAEARVIAIYNGVVLAERIVPPNADKKTAALPKKLEILIDEKTVFVKLTSLGPVTISRKELSEGDVFWVYNHIRTLKEILAAPADPVLAVPFADMLKNPRERIKAEFVVKIGQQL